MGRVFNWVVAVVGVVTLLVVSGVAFLIMRSQARERRMAVIEARILSRPFAAPADGILSARQLSAVIDVECAVSPIRARRVRDGARLDRESRNDHPASILTSLSAINTAFEEVRARAEALDRGGLGFKEYDYVVLAIGETPWDVPSAVPSTSAARRWSAEALRANGALFQRQRDAIARCIPVAEIRETIESRRWSVDRGRR